MERRLAHRMLVLVLLVAAAASLAACGDEHAGTDGSTTPTQRTQPSGGGATGSSSADLKITMQQVSAKSGAGVPLPTRMSCTKSTPATCTSTVTCPATGDADPAPCDWMAEHGGSLATIAQDTSGRACTMIYGGPETVKITGTVDDEPIDVAFSRQNGCAIAAWDQAASLWTDPAAT